MMTTSPYPGLRPFRQDEASLFFGREEQTDDLLRRLDQNRFLAVVGTSGCGKSSLVRAGLIAALETGFMTRAGSRWRIAIMRPGSHPLRRLAEALVAESALGAERTRSEMPFLSATLRRGPLGLVEVLREKPLPANVNLLLVVDQFEEIFRFRKDVDSDEADAFVALLLATAAQSEASVYVVVAMRSDYIGDCAVFAGLPEVLNESQYLTPRMSRDHRHKAILNPVRVFGGDIEPVLVNRLLNESGTDPAQLPVLQHLLMRMWETAGHGSGRVQCGPIPLMVEGAGAAREERHEPTITMADYERVGGLKEALSLHADEAYLSLDETQREIAEKLFRMLTERSAEKKDLRRPTSIQAIADRAGVSPEEVKRVAEVFRDPRYNFITPPPPEELYPNTVLDISHESLIRLWSKLNVWADDEAKSAETYRYLVATAARYDKKEAGLWRPPELDIGLAWRKRERPSPEWAKRYGSDEEFVSAMRFLEASEDEHLQIVWRAREAQKRKLRRSYRLTIASAAAALLMAVGILLYLYLGVWDYRAYYVSFVKVRGAPMGVGELSSPEVEHRPSSLRITRQGRWGVPIRMEAVDYKKELTRSHSIGTYFNQEGGEQSVRWEFAYDSEGRVVQENGYDLLNRRVWGFIYLPAEEGNDTVRIGYFVGPDGYPRAEEEYSGNVVQLTYDKNSGYEVFKRYRSRGLRPVRGPNRAFGEKVERDPNGMILRQVSLGPDDAPMDDEAGNAIFEITNRDRFGNILEAVARDSAGRKTLVKKGFSIVRYGVDAAGNDTSVAYFDSASAPISCSDGYHKLVWRRDNHGRVREGRYYDTQGRPTPGAEGYFSWTWAYDDQGNIVETANLGPEGKPTTGNKGYAMWLDVYDARHNLIERQFHDVNGGCVVIPDGYSSFRCTYLDTLNLEVDRRYYSCEGKPTPCKEGYARRVREYDSQARLTRISYYDTLDQPTRCRDGYASVRYAYDVFGNTSRKEYLGPDGMPTMGGELAIYGWLSRHDASGREIECAYLDSSGKLMLSSSHIAGFRREYDEVGNQKQESYFGMEGAPATMGGYAGLSSRHDALGNEIERTYFGKSGEPATVRGYTKWTAVYDRRGNLTDIRFFDAKNRPTVVPWRLEEANTEIRTGGARRVCTYTDFNELASVAYYDAKGRLLPTPDGWARAAYGYDAEGNQTSLEYFGSDNKPVNVRRGMQRIAWTYNERRQRVDCRYFDKTGKQVNSVEGYSRFTTEYDDMGRLQSQSTFDMADRPVSGLDQGCHGYVRKYDTWGQMTECSYWAGKGQPALNKFGYHAIRYTYTPGGKVAMEAYFDSAGHSTISTYGVHAIVYAYDRWGNIIESSFLGIHMEPVEYQHFWKKTYEYNDVSQLVGDRFFHISGNELGSRHFRYDRRGVPIDTVVVMAE